jgi:hypothetical protein
VLRTFIDAFYYIAQDAQSISWAPSRFGVCLDFHLHLQVRSTRVELANIIIVEKRPDHRAKRKSHVLAKLVDIGNANLDKDFLFIVPSAIAVNNNDIRTALKAILTLLKPSRL